MLKYFIHKQYQSIIRFSIFLLPCYMFSSFKKLASDGFATVNATLKEANSTLKEAGAAMREPQPSTRLLELDEAIVAGKKAALAANPFCVIRQTRLLVHLRADAPWTARVRTAQRVTLLQHAHH